jgi:predicted RNase H-like nuclease (RuvC/YqgF family)
LKFFLSAAGLLALLAAGCLARSKPSAVTAESTQTRLRNQARAVAALSSENNKLRGELKELEARNEALARENIELRKQAAENPPAKR